MTVSIGVAILAFFVGGVLGIFVMALAFVARDADAQQTVPGLKEHKDGD